MTSSAAVRQRTPHGQALRRLVARHPVATFLLLVFSGQRGGRGPRRAKASPSRAVSRMELA